MTGYRMGNNNITYRNSDLLRGWRENEGEPDSHLPSVMCPNRCVEWCISCPMRVPFETCKKSGMCIT